MPAQAAILCRAAVLLQPQFLILGDPESTGYRLRFLSGSQSERWLHRDGYAPRQFWCRTADPT
jgi:hypothetical protein